MQLLSGLDMSLAEPGMNVTILAPAKYAVMKDVRIFHRVFCEHYELTGFQIPAPVVPSVLRLAFAVLM